MAPGRLEKARSPARQPPTRRPSRLIPSPRFGPFARRKLRRLAPSMSAGSSADVKPANDHWGLGPVSLQPSPPRTLEAEGQSQKAEGRKAEGDNRRPPTTGPSQFFLCPSALRLLPPPSNLLRVLSVHPTLSPPPLRYAARCSAPHARPAGWVSKILFR